MTVADLLEIMNYKFAMLAVSVDDETVHKDDYSARTIEDGANVRIVHICHGGRCDFSNLKRLPLCNRRSTDR